MPERIQLSRRKGWRKPEGAIIVARPSLWGNPFKVADWGLDLSVALYRDLVHGIWSPSTLGQDKTDEQFAVAYEARSEWLRRMVGHPTENARFFLRGRDLACWCPLVDADGNRMLCHADVLLELANPGWTP